MPELKERCDMKSLLMMTAAFLGVCATQLANADGATTSVAAGKDATCPAGTCVIPIIGGTAVQTPTEGVINTEALAAMLRTKVPMTLLDARAGKYDDGRRIPGAVTLAPTAKNEEVRVLLPDKTALVVTYCVDLKCPASHLLGEKLRSMGYVNVLEYHEGIMGWSGAGNAVQVEKTK